MTTAIVHEWLYEVAGSEKVMAALLQAHAHDAGGVRLHVLFNHLPPAGRAWLQQFYLGQPHTTLAQHLPALPRYLAYLVPFLRALPLTHALANAQLVISSQHTLAHALQLRPEQLHLVYCHSPMRAAWDLREDYVATLPAPLRPLARWQLAQLQKWDARMGQRPFAYAANSAFVAARVRNCYGRDATVIYPPVEVGKFPQCAEKDDYFLAAGRLVPYKQQALVVAAFRGMPQHRLLVAGTGPDAPRLQALAAGAPNIQFLGAVPDTQLAQLLQRARALVLASIEDFGITTVEALACGTPVLGYGQGGITEIITPATGLLYPTRSVAALQAAVTAFVAQPRAFSAAACAERAQHFAPAKFQAAWANFVATQQQLFARPR